MKRIALIAILLSLIPLLNSFTKKVEVMNKTEMLYEISINSLMGEPIDLSDFKGKKILFVNVASKCGYTPQYAGLQELSNKYKDKLVVIGIPCNQFGGQEPGSKEEIAQFCEKNYGVTFLITEKVDVKGENQHPLYGWLTQKQYNQVEDTKVKWNFQKYLVDENGKYVAKFDSGVKPMSDDLVRNI